MRQVCLDVETTGRSCRLGNRVIEIGCVEVCDLRTTGKTYQVMLDPECDIEEGAQRVHGISREMLIGKPKFGDIVTDFLEFIEGTELVIHNASFDLGFLNNELSIIGMPKLTNPCLDTIAVSRRKFPGQQASLDALCRRLGVDNEHRVLHGALLDAELLAEVFIRLFEREGITENFAKSLERSKEITRLARKAYKTKGLVPKASAREVEKHSEFVKSRNIDTFPLLEPLDA